MTDSARARKRWQREHRTDKGKPKPVPHCQRCGHKLSRFGCTYCEPSILNIADERLGYNSLDSLESALMVAAAARSGRI